MYQFVGSCDGTGCGGDEMMVLLLLLLLLSVVHFFVIVVIVVIFFVIVMVGVMNVGIGIVGCGRVFGMMQIDNILEVGPMSTKECIFFIVGGRGCYYLTWDDNVSGRG